MVGRYVPVGVVGEPCRGRDIELVEQKEGVEVPQLVVADAPSDLGSLTFCLFPRQDDLGRHKANRSSAIRTKHAKQNQPTYTLFYGGSFGCTAPYWCAQYFGCEQQERLCEARKNGSAPVDSLLLLEDDGYLGLDAGI